MENLLNNRYEKLYHCMVERQTSELAKLLDDSFVLTHMTGMQQSKVAFLRSIEDGTLRYFSAQAEYTESQISRTSAVLTGQSIVEAAVFGGGRHTWRLQLTIYFRKINKAWLMTKAIASTY